MNYLKLLWDLALLKRNEKKSPAQVRALQEKKLRKILRFAYENSSYYRDAFAQARITEQDLDTTPLSAFPTLDKTGLLTDFDRLITVPSLTQEDLRRFDAEEAADRQALPGALSCGPLLGQHGQARLLPLRRSCLGPNAPGHHPGGALGYVHAPNFKAPPRRPPHRLHRRHRWPLRRGHGGGRRH